MYVSLFGPKARTTVEMALDTGATRTLIPFESAILIGYNPATSKRNIEIATASGTVLTPVITIKSMRCWGNEVKNVDVVCHDLPQETPVRGLLGLNFLKHFDLHLLFKQRLLEVS